VARNANKSVTIIFPMVIMAMAYAIPIRILPSLTNFGLSGRNYSLGTMRGYELEVKVE
jgi:hypothetical protein